MDPATLTTTIPARSSVESALAEAWRRLAELVDDPSDWVVESATFTRAVDRYSSRATVSGPVTFRRRRRKPRSPAAA